MSAEPANHGRRRSRAAAKAAKPKDAREKITLLISKDTNVKLSTLAALKGAPPVSDRDPRAPNVKLSTLAALKGVDRSTLEDAILGDALRHVVIALRGPLAEGGGAGEGEETSPPASDEATEAA